MSHHNHQRVDSSFQSAKKDREDKVADDIEKFKFRMSFYNT